MGGFARPGTAPKLRDTSSCRVCSIAEGAHLPGIANMKRLYMHLVYQGGLQRCPSYCCCSREVK